MRTRLPREIRENNPRTATRLGDKREIEPSLSYHVTCILRRYRIQLPLAAAVAIRGTRSSMSGVSAIRTRDFPHSGGWLNRSRTE